MPNLMMKDIPIGLDEILYDDEYLFEMIVEFITLTTKQIFVAYGNLIS